MANDESPTNRCLIRTRPAAHFVHFNGFSLVELLMVIAIITAISAIAIPRHATSLAHYRVEGATRRIAADLAYARSQAQASSKSETVNFDVAGDTYNLPGIVSLVHPAAVYLVDLSAEPYRCTVDSVVFDDTSDPSDDVAVVNFDGYGMPDSGGTVQVRSGGITKTVFLNMDTGTASAQ